MKRKYYIAYGSNLHVDQMLQRCPDAVKLGSTVLNGYTLLFRGNGRHVGVATVELCAGESVPIGVWAISQKDEISLDHYEGWPWLYEKKVLPITLNGKRIAAMMYVMTPGHRIAPPSSVYYETIAQGYEDFGLDPMPLINAAERCRYKEDY